MRASKTDDIAVLVITSHFPDNPILENNIRIFNYEETVWNKNTYTILEYVYDLDMKHST